VQVGRRAKSSYRKTSRWLAARGKGVGAAQIWVVLRRFCAPLGQGEVNA
jgi:hypothetical protein